MTADCKATSSFIDSSNGIFRFTDFIKCLLISAGTFFEMTHPMIILCLECFFFVKTRFAMILSFVL